MLPATQIKRGMCIVISGEPYIVLERRHITLGRKSGKIQLKLRNIVSGLSTEKRFMSDEKIEIADLEEKEMSFIYEDGKNYHFMDQETFDEIEIDEEIVGENKFYLSPNLKVNVSFFEGKPIGIKCPKYVVLEVVETPPNIKHSTAQAQNKPAITDTGLRVLVPSFIEPGTKIKVNTETGEYLERA